MWIVFEGGDGCGKTTQIKNLEEILRKKNIEFLSLREPGSTPLGEKLRDFLLSDTAMLPDTETLLFFAARLELLNRVIFPALEKGLWVILDRFIDSTIAYQGYARGGSLELINSLEKFCTARYQPHRIYILDADPKLKRHQSSDRFEKQDELFHQNVRQAYLDRAAQARYYRVLDGSQSKEKISACIQEDLNALDCADTLQRRI